MQMLLAAAAYVWTQIVVPGTTVGNASGPNDKGQVAVHTPDVNGIYQDGTFTPLPAPPPGYQVGTLGINNAGVVVGIAITSVDPHEQGFILVDSVYRFFSRPGWQNTEPRSIGNSGAVTGWSFNDDGTNAGFVYEPRSGTFTDATPSGSTRTIVQGINKFGRISGNGQQAGLGRYGFIWQQGTLTKGKRELVPFLDRSLVADGQTSARGINDAGIITGFTSSGGKTVGFVGSAASGYQLLLPPGADAPGISTFCTGINNAAQVICSVSDAGGNSQNFIGSPREHDGEHDDEHDDRARHSR